MFLCGRWSRSGLASNQTRRFDNNASRILTQDCCGNALLLSDKRWRQRVRTFFLLRLPTNMHSMTPCY